MLLLTPTFQTWASQRIAAYLSEKLHTKITIGGVDIDFVKSIVLEKVYVEDLRHDTLLYTNKLKVDITSFNIEKNTFNLKQITLDKPIFHLKVYRGATTTNLQFLIDYFKTPPSSTKKTNRIFLKVNNIKINEATFVYQNINKSKNLSRAIDYNNIAIRNLNADIRNITYANDLLKASVYNCSFYEKSGFTLTKLSTDVRLSKKEISCSKLNLVTPYSNISRYYAMRFDSLKDMSDYINKVRMYAVFENSKISSKDICFFAPQLSTYNQTIYVNGEINGLVKKLYSNNLQIGAEKNTLIKGNFRIAGLPEIRKTFFDLDFNTLRTNTKDVQTILQNINKKELITKIPKQLDVIESVLFKGNFKGTINDFITKGRFSSNVGNIISDVHLQFPPNTTLSYKGVIETESLNLGKLIDNKLLGEVTLNSTVNGKGFTIENLETEVSANINSLQFNGYSYKNISAEGKLARRFFEGSVIMDEPNASLNFDGSIDFSDRNNPEFNFISSFKNLNLKRLNLANDSIVLSSTINANFTGTNIDNMVGSLGLTNTRLINKFITYTIKNILISSEQSEIEKKLTLTSDLADAHINGNYQLSTIVSSVKSILRDYTPSYDWGGIGKTGYQNFGVSINIKNTTPITRVFMPDLTITGATSIYGAFNSDERLMRLSGGIDQIKYKSITIKDFILDSENDASHISINLASTQIIINDSTNINNVSIGNRLANDSLLFNVKLSEKEAINQLDLNGLISFKNDYQTLHILPSEIIIDNQEWQVKKTFGVTFNNFKRIIINDFILSNQQQEIFASGIVSDNSSDILNLKITNLDLNSFNQIFKKYNVSLQGNLNGEATIGGVLENAELDSKFLLKELVYNTDTIGDITFLSTWDKLNRTIQISGNILNKRLRTVELYGDIKTNHKENNLNLYANLNEMDLIVFEPFIRNLVNNVKGKATANLKIGGSISSPEITGKVVFNHASATINYLKTSLTFSDQVTLEKNKILVNNIIVKDIEGNKAILTGHLTHQNFKNIGLDVTLQAKEFMVLNTTEKDNILYYGTAFATGIFSFNGPLNDVKIDINAKTDKGTHLFIPITDENSAKQQQYIRFLQKDSTIIEQEYKVNLSGITMNMNLDVNENAEVQLILDPITGESIKGTGNANLRLAINTLGNFEMFGVYEIAKGSYNFTLQNVISKNFLLEKGGRIRWDGDPLKAYVDLSAIYETRTSILPLILSANPTDTSSVSSGQRVLAQCVLSMKNDLMAPDILFGLRFPEDENITSKVGGYLTNQDNLNTQVASLLVFGRFTNANGNNGNNYALSTDILEAKLASLVSTKNFDLNLENGVGGSWHLFNNRIIIDGNVTSLGNNSNDPNQQTAQASSITGDVSIEYKISEDGRFRTKAFSRTDNNNDLLKKGNSQTEQGIGLFYRIEFDTLGELMRKIFKKEKTE